jgi:hypothetical protein
MKILLIFLLLGGIYAKQLIYCNEIKDNGWVSGIGVFLEGMVSTKGILHLR